MVATFRWEWSNLPGGAYLPVGSGIWPATSGLWPLAAPSGSAGSCASALTAPANEAPVVQKSSSGRGSGSYGCSVRRPGPNLTSGSSNLSKHSFPSTRNDHFWKKLSFRLRETPTFEGAWTQPGSNEQNKSSKTHQFLILFFEPQHWIWWNRVRWSSFGTHDFKKVNIYNVFWMFCVESLKNSMFSYTLEARWQSNPTLSKCTGLDGRRRSVTRPSPDRFLHQATFQNIASRLRKTTTFEKKYHFAYAKHLLSKGPEPSPDRTSKIKVQKRLSFWSFFLSQNWIWWNGVRWSPFGIQDF